MSARQVSRQLREGDSPNLRRRRGIAGLALLSIGSMSVIALYQLGLTRRLPELPLPGFDAEKVTSSDEGYLLFNLPDSVLGIGNSVVTLGLAAMGPADRARKHPWIPIALAGKTALDLMAGGKLAYDQVSQHRALCSWCLLSGATAIGTLSLALPEAREAYRRMTGG